MVESIGTGGFTNIFCFIIENVFDNKLEELDAD